MAPTGREELERRLAMARRQALEAQLALARQEAIIVRSSRSRGETELGNRILVSLQALQAAAERNLCDLLAQWRLANDKARAQVKKTGSTGLVVAPAQLAS